MGKPLSACRIWGHVPQMAVSACLPKLVNPTTLWQRLRACGSVPCGFYARSIEEALDLARQSAEVTHNHPEGIKGAQAIASAIFLAKRGESKQTIKDYIEKTFGYDLHRTFDEIRPDYDFDVTCQGSCPEAILAFQESSDYESAIRLAISLGGDSDTIACMSGGIAAAFYGVPDELIGQAEAFLDSNMTGAIHAFEMAISNR